jgi:hypothetical protein
VGALVSCGNADVIGGRIHVPFRGAWWADLKLDTLSPPSGQVTIAAVGGLSLTGFVIKSGLFVDTCYAKLVGGAGGLTKVIAGAAYQNAQLRDPLGVVLSAAGEVQSSAITSQITGVTLQAWTTFSAHAAQLLDQLAAAAAGALGQNVNWHTMTDGSVWMGVETFPSQSLPQTADIVEQHPAGGRLVIATETPALLPWVTLTDVGATILGVDHWIDHSRIRTWAWTSLTT